MPCTAVTSNSCSSPANLIGRPTPRSTCWRCGNPVCTACSSLRKLEAGTTRRRRICDICLELEPGGPEKVLKRHYQQAGYSNFTITDARNKLAALADAHQNAGNGPYR